ncbi:MAG: 2'-5' RNA ligase [Lachnospiraceae bacterium]|nr:2'-5' RNA ligase [Lachnospiraceae bacterium]
MSEEREPVRAGLDTEKESQKIMPGREAAADSETAKIPESSETPETTEIPERKLASVQRVEAVTPIEGADLIECIHVLGWTVVGKKGELHEGDLCVYFEIDSFLPVCEQFEFLRKSCYRSNPYMGEGFRLKTQRFRGQISQGLILPLTILPQGRDYTIGEDVTELLGVRKWETEERSTDLGNTVGSLPFGIPKTGEVRIQSCPKLLGEFAKVPSYYISTKMDGTSATMYWKDGKFGVCGRNYEFAEDDRSVFWRYAKAHDLAAKMSACEIPDVAIQGEFCGPGIQKNRLKLKKPEWYVFTVIDLNTYLRYSLKAMLELCEKLGLQHVPIEEQGEVFPYKTIDELLERAKGKYPSGSNKEGIVIRPAEPVPCWLFHNAPLSMKVLNNDYLLKE